jgi:hypothetical protein
MVFCAYMAFVYVPWDFLWKPVSRDEEVWFGIMFTGWGAKLTEPLHWAIYAAGFYGFYRMRSWMWPWAAAYAASVAIGMLVWPLLYQHGFCSAPWRSCRSRCSRARCGRRSHNLARSACRCASATASGRW